MASEQLVWNSAPLRQRMAVAVRPGVCARSKGWQILGGLEPAQGDVMLFWAPCGRVWMATDEQRACTHCEGSVRNLHPAGPRNRVASQRRTPRQVLVLASSCVKWCRSIRDWKLAARTRPRAIRSDIPERRDRPRVLPTSIAADLQKQWWAFVVRVWRTMSHVIIQ